MTATLNELRPGLWTWTAPHPEWTPEHGGPEGWDEMVRSYAVATGSGHALIDPMSPPDELLGGDVTVVLTCSWHRRSASDVPSARVVAPADEPGAALPDGVVPTAGVYGEEVVLWLAEHRALVAGDCIVERGGGKLAAIPDSWLPEGHTRESVRAALRPLLELPIELVLPTHGDPVTSGAREALAAAIG